MRIVRVVLILGLALAGAALGRFLLKGHSQPVAVAQLWTRRQDWQGRTVVVTGTFEAFSDASGSYYVIEQDGYRVGAAGVTAEAAKPLVGKGVRAAGTFLFSEKGGGFLQVRSISPLEPKS